MTRKAAFGNRLAALVEDARQHAPKAVYIALYMVNACLVHGKSKALARHICGFGALSVNDAAIEETGSAAVRRVM